MHESLGSFCDMKEDKEETSQQTAAREHSSIRSESERSFVPVHASALQFAQCERAKIIFQNGTARRDEEQRKRREKINKLKHKWKMCIHMHTVALRSRRKAKCTPRSVHLWIVVFILFHLVLHFVCLIRACTLRILVYLCVILHSFQFFRSLASYAPMIQIFTYTQNIHRVRLPGIHGNKQGNGYNENGARCSRFFLLYIAHIARIEKKKIRHGDIIFDLKH